MPYTFIRYPGPWKVKGTKVLDNKGTLIVDWRGKDTDSSNSSRFRNFFIFSFKNLIVRRMISLFNKEIEHQTESRRRLLAKIKNLNDRLAFYKNRVEYLDKRIKELESVPSLKDNQNYVKPREVYGLLKEQGKRDMWAKQRAKRDANRMIRPEVNDVWEDPDGRMVLVSELKSWPPHPGGVYGRVLPFGNETAYWINGCWKLLFRENK